MKNWIMVLLMMGITLTAFGQRDNNIDREKLNAARIGFITNRLSITPEQAEKFWPLFNEHEQARMSMMREMRNISKKSEGEISNEEARELIQARFDIQMELLNAEKTFLEKVSETLSPVQSLRLNEANRDFTRHIYRMQRRERGSRDRENED
ncbi:Spy/CpxP family protein refolding chaperone [Cyclobacterium sp.]|uniref:Spy/CpxP family protein refolding chaperone n=1 Tax=Cyclobacterium sp. TaxID=1966343 RepID=UPI0019B3AA1E|nr:Spy/CpxP family protein refolding chaperone [Cyclobacterium sp.]MBD3630935.1 Spy/CpxP family protein refolding chaperone [Cyclobacterium sp.]